MKANKGKTATTSVVQRTPNGKGVTFNDPVATVSVNQRVPNKDNPVSTSSANAPEPSPTNEDSTVEFDSGEEHATAASATQKAPTANMLNDNDIDSQLAMENEHDSNDAPYPIRYLLHVQEECESRKQQTETCRHASTSLR